MSYTVSRNLTIKANIGSSKRNRKTENKRVGGDRQYVKVSQKKIALKE